MKKISISIITVFIFFVCQFQLPAQDIRTIRTKVADMLAQMPAQNSEHLDKVLSLAISTGNEGLDEMLGMLKPAGQGDDVAVRFLLTSLARYTSQPGHEKEWNQIQSCFLNAIETSANKEIQAYLIHQLNYGGNDRVVEPLKKYLINDRLCEPVTQLFICVGSKNAENAFIESLFNSSGRNRVTLIKALGEMKSANALPQIQKLTGTTDSILQRTILSAMANIGDPNSYPLLWDAANKAAFQYEPTEAMAALLKYTQQLGLNNQLVPCKTACLAILKTNTKKELLHNQAAALSIYAKFFPKEVLPILINYFGSPDSSLRMAVLRLVTPLGDAAYTAKWIKKARKSSLSEKADIIYMLGERKDKTAIPFIRKNLSDNSSKIRLSSVWALVKLEDQLALNDLLNQLIKGYDVAQTENALLTIVDAKNLDAVALSIDKANDSGKCGLIDLIAAKSGQDYFKTIFPYTSYSEHTVKSAAISSLKSIAVYQNLNQLLTLLARENDTLDIYQLQMAIIQIINDEANPDQAVIPVITALQQSSQKEKYLPVLSSIGGQKALFTVSDLFDTSAGNLKSACFNALVNWKGYQASTKLYAICSHEVTEYKAEALRGFVNQIRNSSLPDDQKLLKMQMIMPYAQTNEDKILIIDALSNVKTFLALLFVNNYFNDPALQQACASAITQIVLPGNDSSEGLFGDIPKAILKKAAEVLSGPESEYIKEKINRYLETISGDPGFVSMFNGKDLNGWRGFVTDPIKKAALTEKELAQLQENANLKMHENWKVLNGMIVFNGDGDNLLSDKEYGDFEMIVNWKISKKGDSGIYLRGSPQVQIWDTSRVEVGAQVGSGGLYNNQINPGKPLKVADNPIGEWNTFRITMIGDKVTVYLNGELVVDHVVMENYWNRNIPIFPAGTIELQAHGTDLAFKDIYVREIKSTDATVSPQEKAEGYFSVFNGKDLTGWVGNKTDYKAMDGDIVIQPSNGEGGGNLYTEKEYSNFDFKFEFQLTPGANNGLGIRAPLEGDAAYVGMELQILDNTAAIYADLKPYQYHGSVYGVIPARREYLKPLGEWNYEEVIAMDNHIKIILNGTAILDGDIKEASKNGTMDGKDHPGLLRAKGHIGFLGHGSSVKFRNIRMKEL